MRQDEAERIRRQEEASHLPTQLCRRAKGEKQVERGRKTERESERESEERAGRKRERRNGAVSAIKTQRAA